MRKIGIIAPTEQLYDMSLPFIEELGIANQVTVRRGNLEEGVVVAREMEAEGVQVIISRGGTVEFITRSEVGIPVVAVGLTCQELSQAVFDAKIITALPRPRIALLLARNMTQDVDLFARVLGIELRVYPVYGIHESIHAAVTQAQRDGSDVIVGGTYSIRAAAEAGFKTVLLPTSGTSIRSALEEARKMISMVELEQARTQRFKTLVGHIREGVLYVDTEGQVRIANPAAEAMLGRTAKELCACRIGDIIPSPVIDECLGGGGDSAEELVRVGNAVLVATIIPAHVGHDLSGVIVSLQETNRIQQMDQRIRKSLNQRGLAAAYSFDDILGRSAAIREAKRLAADYAATDSTILVFGETGTGKELFAQSIHNAGRHAGGPFVAVNCAALPPSLLESELFGYEEGAFTGASRRGKPGLVELAHNGTLFLDEISEMDHYGQVRLLRFLQERQIMRLGGDKYLPVQVRVIAATNRDLGKLVKAGTFREDLYYRLRVLTLEVPPLRDRHGDALFIAGRLLEDWEARLGCRIGFVPEVGRMLDRHAWPGNVRELANVLENLIVLGRRSTITAEVTVHSY